MVGTFLIEKGCEKRFYWHLARAFRRIAVKKNDKKHTKLCCFKNKSYLCSSLV